jgi:bilin biosynthesis protein
MRYWLVPVSLVVCLGTARLSAAEPDTLKVDEQTLKEAKLAPEGLALLDYFRRRTIPESDQAKIEELVKKLGDDTFQVRENATEQLVVIGAPAVPFLTQAAKEKDGDIEVIRRAEHCLKLIEKTAGPAVTTAALRVLAHRKPDGTAEVLLKFVPFADDETVAEEVRRTLAAVAVGGGKPDKAVQAALEDKLSARRAAAVQAVIRASTAEQRAGLRKYLQDADSNVRLQAALAFFDSKDGESIPVLIALLTELPADRLWRVEDNLILLAGEKGPTVSLGGNAAKRREARDAWQAWWDKDGKKIDLTKLDLAGRLLGRTLIVEMPLRARNGRVLEIGKDGKTIWEFAGLLYPIDAQVVGDDRVLVAEFQGRRVTERDFKGEVKWEKAVPALPISATRLPDGNTLICSRNQLLEVDKDGKEFFAQNRNDLVAAQKRRDGEYVILTSTGKVIRIDATGKEVKSFDLENVAAGRIGIHFDLLPNGRVVVPVMGQGKVQEYDQNGKKVWEAAVELPTSAVRLPNGHTLVVSSNTQRVVELNREGTEVWEYKGEGRVLRVRRR